MGNEVDAGKDKPKTAVDKAQAPEAKADASKTIMDEILGTPPAKKDTDTKSDTAAATPPGGKPEAPKPEAPKPEAPKPEAPKPEAPKPEAPKADVPPPDSTKPGDNPLFREPEAPPAAVEKPVPGKDVVPPAAPTDVLAGVIDPTFKALVDDKSAKMVTHIENGAQLLKQGLPREATNAYRAAADLVSPEEQKMFLQKEQELKKLIKAETEKPADQQDAKKLEALKEIERKTRTLGRVDMFTEVNSGLIWTQAGNMKEASECFARAFKNEKAMIDAKALPPEGYLSKDPNLGARVNEISRRLDVNIWKLMGDSVQRSGLDPKVVGLDTGRGPPVRTEGGDPVPAPVEPAPATPPRATETVPKGPTEVTKPEEAPKPREVAPAPTEAGKEKGTERTVTFSKLDDQGRSPLERVGFWIDKAMEGQKLTQEQRTEIEKAIAEADKGRSPKIKELQDKATTLEKQTTDFLNAKVGNTQETVLGAVNRIDQSVNGTFEEKPDPNDATKKVVVKTKEGIIDKLVPPTAFVASDEVKNAKPPADYKPTVAKPADFKGTDEEFRTAQYRSDLRTQEYRQKVQTGYNSLDQSLSQTQYAEKLAQLKALVPDNKAFTDALTERDQVMTQARTSLLELNMTNAKIPAEINQSAVARNMYAEILSLANDPEGAKKWATEAYAWNQIPEQRDGFRSMAMAAGANPMDLLEAAVKQNQARGTGNYEKCMRTEDLLQESNFLFASAKPEFKADILKRMTPVMKTLQGMADNEYAQVTQRSKDLNAQYESLLPQDPAARKEFGELQTRMSAAEKNFSQTDLENASKAMNASIPEADRNKASEALKASQPDWFKDQERMKALVGDKGPAIAEVQAAVAVHSSDVIATGQNLFYSRAILANMQAQTNDMAGAKQSLTEAFGAVPKAAREALLANSQEVTELAKKVGLDAATISNLPEPVVKTVDAPTVPKPETTSGDTPTGPGTDTTKAPGTDTPAPPAEAPKFQGDPRFAKMTDEQINLKIAENAKDLTKVQETKDLYKELIARIDAGFSDKDFAESVPSMKLLTEALKQGKDIKDGPDGKPVLGDEPLSADRRLRFHVAVFGDMQMMNEQVRIRQEFAQYLKASGQFKDAEAAGLDARDKAERLTTPMKVDGKDVRVVDLMKQEAAKILEDLPSIPTTTIQMANGENTTPRAEMLKARSAIMGEDSDSGFVKSPITTNKFLAQLYLGTEVVPQINDKGQIAGIKEIKFGQGSAFKPELAIDPAQRALQFTRDITGLDPLDKNTAKDNPGIASLFGVLADVMDNPENYKLYVGKKGETFTNEKGEKVYLNGGELVGKNDAGIPIIIQKHSIANLQQQIRKDSAFDSLLIDAGVVIGVLGTMAATRNPKVAAFFEKSLGPYGSYAGKVLKVAEYAAPAVGVVARNQAYQAMTGVKESWTDSIVHVGGSLAAAELGGRASGRGSFLTGTSRGPIQFARMDAKASAEFYAREGYETTGKLMDLLKSQGYINEAKAFVNMPRGTKLVAEGVLDPNVAAALEKAQLTGARTGSVAEAIMKDAKSSSGIKHDAIAARIAQADAGGVKTIGDLKKMVRNDQQALQDLAKKTGGLPDNANIREALADIASTPQGQQLLATAERFGVTKVGQAHKLAAETEKLSFKTIFPKLDELQSAGVTVERAGKTVPAVTDATKLTDVVGMGTHVLEGPGLQRLLSLVPAAERTSMLTPAALKEVMAASPITGERSLIGRMKDGYTATKDGVASAFNTVTTKQGWANMGNATMETLAPLGTKNFYLKTIPGKVYDAGAYSLGKVDGARRVVTDRFQFTAIDPAKATPEVLARARSASGFYGAFASAGTYNTVVKPYDMTGQLFGVTLPQGGDAHPVFTDPKGEDYTWLNALKESHFPTIQDVNPEELPVYARWMVPLASAAVGTPGQALFGSMFMKPGAIYKPVWSNPEYGNFRKTMQSVFPLSPTRWNNWNAGILSNPTMAAGGVFAGTMAPSSLDGVGPRLNVGRYKDLLRNAQKPIDNTPLPTQRTSIEEAQQEIPAPPPKKVETPQPEAPKPATPAPTPDTSKPTPKPQGVEEPPPPGQ